MEDRLAVRNQEERQTALAAARTANEFFYQTHESNPLITYWHILSKRKWAVFTTFLILTTLTTIATLRSTPIFEAVGRVAIFRENSDSLGLKEGGGGLADGDDYDYTVALETQVNVLKSDQLALKVARAMKLDRNPKYNPLAAQTAANEPATQNTPQDQKVDANLIGLVKGGMRVQVLPRTRVVEIRYESPDPKLAAQVVNAVIETFKEENFRAKYDASVQTSEWLGKQLTELQLKVETSQEALVRYQRENNILGIDDKQNITTAKLDELNRQLTSAETDRMQKESAMRMAETGNPEFYSARDPYSLFEKVRSQLSELKSQAAQLNTQFGPSYPKVVALNNQIAQLESEVQSEQAKILGRVRGEYNQAVQRERMLRNALDAQKREANNLNERGIQYTQLKREADGSRELYESLLRRSKEAAVVASLRSGNIRTVDSARVPEAPSKPNIPRNIALGMFMGLLAGIGLAIVLDILDNTVRTPEEAQNITSLPSLGLVPLMGEQSEAKATVGKRLPAKTANGRAGTSLGLVAYGRPKSEVSEAYRALRTSVLLSAFGKAPKVLLLTSPLPQEGKSTTSVNLGIVLAQKGGRVLIVDGDMRRPNIHRTFGVSSTAGLSTLLAGSDTFEKVAVVSPILPNLTILPAGPTPPQPSEMLGSPMMAQLVAQWAQDFDHVIIDSPPVLSVTDAVLLSSLADAVILVIRSGQTTKEALRRSRNLLAQVNARVLGIVMNAVDLRSPDGYYYYYGGKYYGKYYDETAKV
jgi:polysaccharide biosynthesis transport protein